MNTIDTTKPLIWTTKGNLPVEDLKLHHFWIDNDNETTYVEEWYLGEELVKRNVAVMLKKPAHEAVGETANFA